MAPEAVPPNYSEGLVNILLVDDHPANLLALEGVLSPLGQNLVKALSGDEALAFLNGQDAAVILMDVRMPGLDGFKTAELLRQREHSSSVPIIFLTAADTDAAQMMKGYERGGADFLGKPFDPEILRSKVSVFVNLHLKERKIKEQAALLLEHERETLGLRSEAKFRKLMDAMPLCVCVTDPMGEPFYVNRQLREYAGVGRGGPASRESLLANTFIEDRQRLSDEWSNAISEKRQFELKFRLKRDADGSYRWHLGRGIPQLDENGELSEWILTATDIDLESQALIQAQTASQMKDDFMAMVSHELRTPLNAIMGWVYLLRGAKLDSQKADHALETIERSVQSQVSLIDDLLDLSSIVRGKTQLTFRPVDLASIAESGINTMRPAAEAKGLSLEQNDPSSELCVNGDPDRLQQVFCNLLSNAIKFTPSGGLIAVRLERVRNSAKLTVSDTGKGIRPEFLPHVFEPFRQADSGTTREQGGLGLGLAVAQSLVQLHGGTIEAASAGPEMGSVFTVMLPLLYPHQAGASDPSREAAVPRKSLEGIKVLIVDDDTDGREATAELLRSSGAIATTACSSAAALEAITLSTPDVVVSDIAMPGEDGYTFVRKLSEYKRVKGVNIVAIALSGLSTTQHKQRAIEAGFEGFIPKPVQPIRLIEHISSCYKRTSDGMTPQ